MDKENLAYISIIVISLIGISTLSIYAVFYSQDDSNLEVLSSSDLANGDTFSLKLTNSNNEPISNASIEIIVTDVIGQENRFKVTTDCNGVSSFGINIHPGDYSFKCVYDGDVKYKQCNTLQNIKVSDC